jgi:hypothetical protein
MGNTVCCAAEGQLFMEGLGFEDFQFEDYPCIDVRRYSVPDEKNTESDIWEYEVVQNPFTYRSYTSPRTMQGKAPCRLLCYGDSNTAGYSPSSPFHTPYADRLAEGLSRAGVEVAVMCCGLSGKTTK